jgi:UrcA family protein
MNPIRSLIPIVLVASVAAASPAQAESTRIVSYADLDLSSPAGQSALDRRIDNAVRQMCGRAFPSDLQTQHQVRQCREQTAAEVQAQRNDAFAQAQNNRIQLSSRR